MKIALCNVVLTHLVPIEVARQKDALSLAARLWLYYERLSLPKVKLLLELFYIGWELPRFREEIVGIRELLLHLVEILGEEVFAGEGVHARKMVRPLIILHLG